MQYLVSMDFNIHKIENLHVEPPRKDILSRLKFNIHKTKFNEKSLALFEKTLGFAVSLCESRGVYRFMDILEKSERKVVLADGIVFESASLAKLLKNSSKVVMMASTVGAEITAETNILIEKNRASEAIIVDAAASEIVDEVMNKINLLCANLAKKEGFKLTKMRFSPGFGDLSLENQKLFFKALELEKMGLELTESFMIVPEKSVTAVVGVENY
jgi:cobalamin-dependent methionine synthase I